MKNFPGTDNRLSLLCPQLINLSSKAFICVRSCIQRPFSLIFFDTHDHPLSTQYGTKKYITAKNFLDDGASQFKDMTD